MDFNWSDKENAAGYKGTSSARGVAGHGSLSPYEIHIPLIVSGPGFKKEYTSQLPSSNIDIVPTLLHIHKIGIPRSMDGRVLHEVLSEKTKVSDQLPQTQVLETSAKYEGGTYRLRLHRTILGKYKYVDFATVAREEN